MKLPQIVREIGWFGVLGGTATAINYVGALGAQRLLHLAPLAAGFVGYALSVGVSYFGNSLLTFRRPALHGPQFARFAAISLAGLAINLGIVFVATHALGWPLWQALIPVVVIVPASTFVMAKFWAFRGEAEPA
jgi:putative flippase GtrA